MKISRRYVLIKCTPKAWPSLSRKYMRRLHHALDYALTVDHKNLKTYA